MTTAADETQLFLVRFSGEITTKAKGTRIQFQRRLHANIEAALAAGGVEARVERDWTRIWVEAPAAVGELLTQVFGVQSVSPVVRRSWRTLDDLIEAGAELFTKAVAGRRFAVRARRSGDKRLIGFTSLDLDRALGARLYPGAAGVDLTNPEVTVSVEVRALEAFFFTARLAGHGGLPVRTEGRALCLVSGGFDSAVAAWTLLRRGVALDYCFFNLGGATHREGVLKVMKVIADRWSFGSRSRLHVVDLQPAVEAMQRTADSRYWQVILKRLMLRAATRLARRLRVEALVTGDAIGQVSSQTLRNLRVISEATDALILRPLAGANKEEIVARARSIGTYELSAAVDEYCSLDAQRPATKASLAAVLAEEQDLDDALLSGAVDECEMVDLRALDLATLGDPSLGIEAIPEGAEVVDLRSRRAY